MAVHPRKFNKVFSSEFPTGYLVRCTPEEDRRSQRQICCENSKFEVHLPNTTSVNIGNVYFRKLKVDFVLRKKKGGGVELLFNIKP